MDKESGYGMKDKKQMICIVKISLVIQLFLPIIGIMDVVEVVSIPVEGLFALFTFNMVLAAAGIISFRAFQKLVKEEGETAKLQMEKELSKIKRKEEELRQLIQKEENAIKKVNKASRKKQRGKNKDNQVMPIGANSGESTKKEAYPYKEAGLNDAKFVSVNVDMKSDLKKVLIVDDSITHLKLLAAYLKKMNIEARVAKSGKEAIEAVQREKFALILMDHVMKGKNGLDTVKEIRQLKGEYYENIPIVDVLSVGMDPYEAMRSAVHNAGYYQAYLTKPIAYEMLLQVMLTYGVYKEAEVKIF